jgi:hypothetical protein
MTTARGMIKSIAPVPTSQDFINIVLCVVAERRRPRRRGPAFLPHWQVFDSEEDADAGEIHSS